ncbi:DUF5655 domain-containing protein [Actinospica sp.]|jgi:hypothetical protein|uniref:DUF5655 domain-containing protein n=1 Tax=Actinospica sp. TaxID=1872142 RepID=UPI002D1DF7C0|nr:DUF5655 domain-containing protein [Actinospica sp.]HWG23436.1 DUF5655 domain-containing protein [Actinospica sp.]
MPEMRTWQAMRDQIHRQLERQTGEGVEAWSGKIKSAAPADEPALRGWLADRGVTGYPAMLLAWETFGYPDFLTATADELVDAQYADRPDLRPIFDAVVAAISGFEGAEIQARKTYVSLVSPRRTFGIVQASTKKRVDVGLRLDGVEPEGRLLLAKSLGNDTITRRLALESVDDLDDEVLGWISRAYAANS